MDNHKIILKSNVLNEIKESKKLLNKNGFCILEIDDQSIINEDKVIGVYSNFLSHLGSIIPVFQNDDLLWRKIGVKIEKDPQSSEGIGNSPLHIDFVNSTHPPDLVGLLCIRPDKNGGGISLVSNIKVAMAKLSKEERDILKKKVFHNGQFYNLSNIGKEYNPFPVISERENDFIRFTEKLIDTRYTEEIDQVLKKLIQILNNNLIKIPLKRFQLLLLDQRQVVHGKTKLKGKQENIPNSERRELLQVFISTHMENINKHAKILFEFLGEKFTPKKPNFLLVLGSSDLSVAEFASHYFKSNPTEFVVVSGGYGKITKDLWNISEAKKFAEIMIKNGVPKDKIYLDEEATNTGDNIQNAKAIIKKNNLSQTEGVLITKPYMTKRAFNTASKQWDEVKWSSMSENISFEDYLSKVDDKDKFINVLVGDLQRIKIYGEKGFQIIDNVPNEVWNSYEYLANNGFNKFVIKE